ncbi:hypothetical protein F5X96DRAFT_323185 [Biscogniauxia mediterranea]|nr:hypothetical protein F5X96DRAFT_323185 [Biscogniauxia mediterranea]
MEHEIMGFTGKRGEGGLVVVMAVPIISKQRRDEERREREREKIGFLLSFLITGVFFFYIMFLFLLFLFYLTLGFFQRVESRNVTSKASKQLYFFLFFFFPFFLPYIPLSLLSRKKEESMFSLMFFFLFLFRSTSLIPLFSGVRGVIYCLREHTPPFSPNTSFFWCPY